MLNNLNYCENLNGSSTFRELCEVFFKDPYNRFPDIRQYNLSTEFKKYVYPVIGQVELSHFNAEHIFTARKSILKYRDEFFLYRTDHMIARILEYAMMHDLIATNPYTTVPSVPYKPSYNLSCYSDEILADIWSAVKATRFPYLFGFALTTGFILPEIAGIQIEDYDASEHTLHIQRTVQLPRNNKALTLGVPKITRKVYISNAAALMLEKQIHLFQIAKEAYGEVQPWIFLSDENNLPSYHILQKCYRAIANQCNLDSFNFDTIRHNYVIRSLMSGVNVFDLQYQLGMKSPDYLLHLESALKQKQNLFSNGQSAVIEIPTERSYVS